MRIKLITHHCFFIAEQSLHSVKDFSASQNALPVRIWGYTGRWEGAELGQLSQTGQRDTSYHMVSCRKQNEGVGGRAAASWGLAGCQSTSGEQLHCASLAMYIIIIISYYYPILLYTIKLFLSQAKSSNFF